jgi:peptide/nickel transport system permease protein
MANKVANRSEQSFWTRLFRLPRARLGIALITPILLGALLAPVLAPADPTLQFRDGLTPTGLPIPPGSQFPLGTDSLGRDVLSRVLYGAQVSLFITLITTGITVVLGTSVGMLAGYFSGPFDFVLMCVTDVFLAFPAILLALALTVVTQPSVFIIIMVIIQINWPGLARTVRAQVLVVREMAFVEAARSLGANNLHLIFYYIVPHIITLAVIWSALSLAGTVLIEVSLSYLGLGIPLPTASWGNMIADGQAQYRSAPWLIIVPSTAILMTTLGFNLLGDAMRGVLDPRLVQYPLRDI